MSAHTQAFSRFATALTASGGSARLVAPGQLADEIAAIVPGIRIWTAFPAADAHPLVINALRARNVDVRLDGTPETIRDEPLGLTYAIGAIVETGTVILNEPTLDARAVSLMTQHLIVLVPEQALVESLDDAAGILRQQASPGPSYVTFVSGPSRTADIERELAIGVQGPGALTVLVIADA